MAFLGLEWGDVIEGLFRVVGVLPALFGVALGTALFLIAFAWLMRRDPTIRTQAETIKIASGLVLDHTKAVEGYHQQVIDLQNDLDKANDAHAEALKKQGRVQQDAIDQLSRELVQVKKDLKSEREGRAEREQELRNEIAQLADQLEKANDKIGELTAQLTAATATAEDLRQQLAQLQDAQRQDKELIASLQQQIRDYCDTIGRLEVELGRLRHELAEAQAAKDAAEAKLEDERRQMQEQIEQLRKRLDKTETADLTAEVAALSPAGDSATLLTETADTSATLPTVPPPSSDGHNETKKEVSDV